jgi:methylglyoxal synthase
VAVLQNIPVATNRASADFIFSSPLMNESYERVVYDYATRLARERRIEAGLSPNPPD